MLRGMAASAVVRVRTPTAAPELDYKALRKLVGIIAIALPLLTSALTHVYYTHDLTSISESYHQAGLPQAAFVGSLFAIASFLSAYVGMSVGEKWMARVAGVCSLAIAICPCDCGDYASIKATLPHSGTVHIVAAGLMFTILAGFCLLIFFRGAIGVGKSRVVQFPWLRALGFGWSGVLSMATVKAKIQDSAYSLENKEGMLAALRRARIYLICGLLIVIALCGAGICGKDRCSAWPTNMYWFEFLALLAFGVSWLLAGRRARPVTKPVPGE